MEPAVNGHEDRLDTEEEVGVARGSEGWEHAHHQYCERPFSTHMLRCSTGLWRSNLFSPNLLETNLRRVQAALAADTPCLFRKLSSSLATTTSNRLLNPSVTPIRSNLNPTIPKVSDATTCSTTSAFVHFPHLGASDRLPVSKNACYRVTTLVS
ncbi:hypothetical protein BC830DRAFT_1099003 [Chytriomyces sp. MP71]|nr:hypothetical protein BC830DRAFT_1099003 [Chytriomyces sp. MP71]